MSNKIKSIIEILDSNVYFDKEKELCKYFSGNFSLEEFKYLMEYIAKDYDKYKNIKFNNLNLNIDLFKRILDVTKDNKEYVDICYNMFFSNNKGFSSLKKYINNLSSNMLSNDIMLKLLFNNSSLFDEKLSNKVLANYEFKDLLKYINNVNNNTKIFNIICNRYPSDMIKYIKNKNIFDIKNNISMYLFGINYNKLLNYLDVYGNVTDLKIMKFNNRFNSMFDNFHITRLIALTTILESLRDCDNIDNLINLFSSCLKNKNESLELNNYFKLYEEEMKELYLKEASLSLTNIDKLTTKYISNDRCNKYGVKVFDLSKSAYILYGHCLDEYEDMDSIVLGSNSIKVNAVSYRNQFYIGNNKNIIFGYSDISNVYKIEYSNGIYRDIRNISDMGGDNRIILYGSNIRPSCVIIYGDREPTDEEINICKKYNLSIVYTQELNKIIDNPIPIDNQEITIMNEYDIDHQIINNNLSKLNKNDRRKVAIMTDAHGFYEPTLAILEDMRKRGISEIYSLGDNIGFGPNPVEVMDLLREYNVKSIKGNHEEYVLDVFKYKKHLLDTGAYESTLRELEILKKHLTKKEIEEIKKMPKFVELLFKDKKMLLCHYTKGYNSSKEAVHNKDEYEIIFEGHKHRDKESDNVKTLRATAFDHSNEYSKASYIIVEENEDGFEVRNVKVDYNSLNLQSSIIISDMEDVQKDKMINWTGVSKR